MSVEDTKRLILQRLDELRKAKATPGTSPRVEATVEAPAPRQRRWFERSQKTKRRNNSSMESRLQTLEDRLIAVERCFVEKRQARIGRAASQKASLPQPASVEQKPPPQKQRTSKDGFDFGGEPYRLTGDVHDGLITDVLQMVASNQKSGRFSLFLPDDDRFDLIFREGELIHAQAGELEGESAFFLLMTRAHQEGHYGFLQEEVGEMPPTIEGKTQFLILEALRRIDEEAQDGGPTDEKE